VKDFFTVFDKRLELKFERELTKSFIYGTMCDQPWKKSARKYLDSFGFSAQIGAVVG